MRTVDLDEKVIATFYSEEYEEWTRQTTTIEDVLDSVCDEYTVLPSEQPDVATDINVGDTISRQQAIDEVAKWFYDVFGIKESDGTATIFKRLRELPTALPERKKGKWILTEDDNYEYCTCSECGYQNGENWMNGSDIPFCAVCGADMRGESDD